MLPSHLDKIYVSNGTSWMQVITALLPGHYRWFVRNRDVISIVPIDLPVDCEKNIAACERASRVFGLTCSYSHTDTTIDITKTPEAPPGWFIATPQVIAGLKNPVFAFPSYLSGRLYHAAGDYARRFYGAMWGEANGPTGNCGYAIPCWDRNASLISWPLFEGFAEQLFTYCRDQVPDRQVMIANYYDPESGRSWFPYKQDMLRELFSKGPANVVFPESISLTDRPHQSDRTKLPRRLT